MALRGEAEEPLLGKEGSYYSPTQPYSNFNEKPYWIQKMATMQYGIGLEVGLLVKKLT